MRAVNELAANMTPAQIRAQASQFEQAAPGWEALALDLTPAAATVGLYAAQVAAFCRERAEEWRAEIIDTEEEKS